MLAGMAKSKRLQPKDRKAFRRRLETACLAAGIDKSEAARRAGIGRGSLGTMMRTGNPQLAYVEALGRALGCALSNLVEDAAGPAIRLAEPPPPDREEERARTAKEKAVLGIHRRILQMGIQPEIDIVVIDLLRLARKAVKDAGGKPKVTEAEIVAWERILMAGEGRPSGAAPKATRSG